MNTCTSNNSRKKQNKGMHQIAKVGNNNRGATITEVTTPDKEGP